MIIEDFEKQSKQWFKDYSNTCSLSNPKNNSVSFIRDKKYIHLLKNIDKHIYVMFPRNMGTLPQSEFIKYIVLDVDVDFKFTVHHNMVNKKRKPAKNIISKKTKIHKSVIIGEEGLKFANASDGSKIQFKHMGNVIIEDDVEIHAYTVVHRAGMDSTIIKRGVKIGSLVNIGHNNIIDEDTIIGNQTITCGSVKIGKNCWIGVNSAIKNGVSICDNVILGMNSLVTRDIIKPGIYYGSPVRYIKPYVKGWNF